MVFRHALRHDKSFANMTQILVNNKNLSRTSAESIAYNNVEVCGKEMKISLIGMDEYSGNEIKYRQNIVTGMRVKSSSKIVKNLEKLKIRYPLQRLLGVDGLLDRLELRQSLEKLSMMEFLGRREDMDQFKKYVKMDLHEYPECEELNDLIDNVCTRVLNPSFKLTTCTLANATYIARRNNIADREDAAKVGTNPTRFLPPPASEDPHVYIFEGKMNYNVNKNLKLQIVLVLPICEYYGRRRQTITNSNYTRSSIADRARCGKSIHLIRGACIIFNFPHWPNEECECTPDQKFCFMYRAYDHGASKCLGFNAVAKTTKFNKNWLNTPAPDKLAIIFNPKYHILKSSIQKNDNDNFARGSYRGRGKRGWRGGYGNHGNRHYDNYGNRNNDNYANTYTTYGGSDNTNNNNKRPPTYSGNPNTTVVTIPPPKRRRN